MEDKRELVRIATIMAEVMDRRGHHDIADDLHSLAQMAHDDFDVPQGGQEYEVKEDEDAEVRNMLKNLSAFNAINELAEQLGNIVGFSVENYAPRGELSGRDLLRLHNIVAELYDTVNNMSSNNN